MLIARLPEEWINSTGPHASPRSLFESQFTGTYNGPNPFASRPTETCLTRSPLYNSRLTAVSWEIRGHFPRSIISKILAEGWRVGETDLGILNVGGENWERRPSVGRSRWEIGNGSREKFDSCSFYVTRGRGRNIRKAYFRTGYHRDIFRNIFVPFRISSAQPLHALPHNPPRGKKIPRQPTSSTAIVDRRS